MRSRRVRRDHISYVPTPRYEVYRRETAYRVLKGLLSLQLFRSVTKSQMSYLGIPGHPCKYRNSPGFHHQVCLPSQTHSRPGTAPGFLSVGHLLHRRFFQSPALQAYPPPPIFLARLQLQNNPFHPAIHRRTLLLDHSLQSILPHCHPLQSSHPLRHILHIPLSK